MAKLPRSIFAPVCPTPGCGRITTGGLCAGCEADRQRRVDARRPSSSRRGYDERWRRASRAYLREHPLCECGLDCCPNGCNQPAKHVDHRDGLGPLGPRGYDRSNWQALAHGCHSRKTVRADGGFGRAPT